MTKTIACIPEKFDLSVRPMVLDFLNQTPIQSCEYNFVNLFCWEEAYQYTWFIHEERLVVHDGADGILFMPIGPPLDPKSLHFLSVKAMEMGLSPDICLVTQEYLTQFPKLDQYYTITQDRDAAEYIYLAQNLAALKGSKLHKKRNLISQFKRKYPNYRVLPVTRENKFKVKDFAQDLLGILDPVPKTLVEESWAMAKVFDYWDELGLEGIMVVVEDNIAAFCVFSRMNLDTYNIHFEKSNLTFKGAAQVINMETAQLLKDKTRYLNREQDLGIPGLRQAKLSYEPHHLFIPYLLKFKA